MEIGRTIAAQLGNPCFALLGAKDLLIYGSEDCKDGFLGGLRFRIGKNPERVTHIFIALAGDDTYTVAFDRYNKRTFETVSVSVAEGVYADMLHGIIESGTGLLASF